MLRRILDWVEVLTQIAMVVVGVWLFGSETQSAPTTWCALAAFYLVLRLARLRAPRPELPGGTARLAMRLRLAFATFASLIGMTGALIIVVSGMEPDTAMASRITAVPMVLLAWGVLHFAFSDVYLSDQQLAQRLGNELPFQFPGKGPVEPSDYVYFAFTLGTTFATSDVEVCVSSTRRTVVLQAVLSFLYNTAILGTAIGVMTK